MTRTLVTLALSLLLPHLAFAASSSLPWLNATIRFNPAVWNIRAPGGGLDILMTCIAPDCEGHPTLYGYAWRVNAGDTPCGAIAATGRDTELLPISATPLGFAAIERWSGCRALDTPIIEACAASGGTAWRIVSRVVASGCSRDAPLPPARFYELLRSIVPAPASP